MHVAPLNHQGAHQWKAERLAVWIEIGGQRERDIVLHHPLHVRPWVAHRVRRAREKTRVHVGMLHLQSDSFRCVVSMICCIDAKRTGQLAASAINKFVNVHAKGKAC